MDVQTTVKKIWEAKPEVQQKEYNKIVDPEVKSLKAKLTRINNTVAENRKAATVIKVKTQGLKHDKKQICEKIDIELKEIKITTKRLDEELPLLLGKREVLIELLREKGMEV